MTQIKNLVGIILLILGITLLFGFNSNEQNSPENLSKYKVGDSVKCSQWENETFWRGKVVRVVKDVLYQVEIEKVQVNGSLKMFLNPSECTGKKRLSYEDGQDFKKTKIWVHQRCLD